MKHSVCVLFLFVCFVGIQAAPPGHSGVIPRGKCLIGDVLVNDGESAPGPVGVCSMIECHVNKKTGAQELSGSGCGEYLNTNPRCIHVGENRTKRFPACCSHYECKDKKDRTCTKEICS